WNRFTANRWRYPKRPSVNGNGVVAPVNIFEYKPDLQRNRLVYLYIEADGCEIVEQCVETSGWRRLLRFSTTAPNFGIEDLQLGRVSYFANDPPSDLVTKYHMFEFSPCHQHFHFSHYANFTFGSLSNARNSKRGFCLQAVYRHANAEWSPLAQAYYTCSNQGIPAGWQDVYQDGIPCQWIDVTSYNTRKQEYTSYLQSHVNPDGFLCEGVSINNSWIETNFSTTCCNGEGCCGNSNSTECCGGEPVYRTNCDYWSGYEDDNKAETEVTLPLNGNGQLTADCWTISGHWGPRRDCGFRLHPYGKYLSCQPGEYKTLMKVQTSIEYQILRVCEASIALQCGMACTWNNSLANVIVDKKQSKNVHFLCPAARDEIETGGRFAVYVAPLFEEDEHTPLSVTWKKSY
ncbi:unnamed protein product, partial [Didymodactylos carnosus]